MVFTQRTRQRIRIALVASLVYASLVASVAALFPQEGKSFLSSLGWWMVAIPVGVAAYLSLELFGTWSLELPFWQRLPSWARILLLVAVVSFISVVIAVVAEHLGGGNAL